MNLAMVGPLPPAQTGIADYHAALLRHLCKRFEMVVAVVDQDTVSGLNASDIDTVYRYRAGIAEWWWGGRSVPLYQMGNHVAYHAYVYDLLRKYPGITVLHDGNLLPFIHAVTLERSKRADYVREVSAALPDNRGHRRPWASLRHAQSVKPEESRLLNRVVHASLGIVVHSRGLRDYVRELCPTANVTVIPHLDVTPPDTVWVGREEARSALGLESEDRLLGAFGFVAPSKRLDSVLTALVKLISRFPQLRLVCVGEVVPGYDIQTRVVELGLQDHVRFTGYVPPEALQLYLQAVDVGLNLRHPTWGESSGTLVRLMAAGKPVLVTDAGAFHDLPDDVVIKVPAGTAEVDHLVDRLAALLGQRELRVAVGSRAQAYLRDTHAPERVADQYAAFIKAVVRGQAEG